jgi:long-chain fatty acid transport protein
MFLEPIKQAILVAAYTPSRRFPMASSRRLLGPALASLLALPTAASAGGFTSARFGGEHGTPTADQVTAIYFNPAALALGRGTRVHVEGLFALRTGSYDRPSAAIDNRISSTENRAGTPNDAVGANSGEATLKNTIVSPFIGVASDLGVENLGVGLAFFVPFGGQSSWDKVSSFEDDPRYPGAVDGSQRWSTIEGELRALYLSAAGSYYLPGPRLAFGASLSFVRQETDTVRARTAAGTDDLVAGDDIVEGRSHIDVAGSSIAAGLGVLWQPVDDLWLGLSYQSQPGFGEAAQKGTLTNQFGAGQPTPSDVELLQALPDVIRVGARYRIAPRIEARLSFDYQRWSVFDRQCLVDATNPARNCAIEADGSQAPDAEGIVVNIPRHWRDTYGVRLGGSYWLTPALELAAGASFDTSAVPAKYLDPALVDLTKAIAHAGVRYALLDGRLMFDLTLNNVFYFGKEIEPRERNSDGTSDGYLAPSRVPDFAGKYALNVFYANLAAAYRF